MKELQEIIKLYEQIRNKGQQVALATVVKTSGSVYRKPGAKMLIASNKETVGTLSGGCLEHDVCYHVENSMPFGKPLVITYDTTTDEDLYFGLGLGCNGVVQILIQQFNSELPSLNFLAHCLHRSEIGVFAIVFNVKGVPDVQIGNYLTLNSTDIKNLQLTEALTKDAQLALNHQQSTINEYHLPQGTVEVFFEVIKPPPSIIIFGGQFDLLPVVRIGNELGWKNTVVDTRKSPASPKHFEIAEQVILAAPEDAPTYVKLNSDTVAVIMTHNYLHDLELLKWLLPSNVFYLGLLGPKHRTERLLKELQLEGITPTDEQLKRLYAPIGLDIGGTTPETIALAIIAEIQTVLAQRTGKFLRERQSSIHQPLNAIVQTISF